MSNAQQYDDSNVILKEEKEVKLKKPRMYKVIMLNDDYTTMEFVVWVLQKIFYKAMEEANKLMMTIHTSGQAVCGIYTRDVAQTKALQVKTQAKKNGHPLKCIIEPET